MVKRKHRRCAYCGEPKEITRDHIPPQVLLEKPFPLNLWTVPACFGCNQGFQLDDDYTASVLTADLRALRNAAAQSNMPALLRSLEKPEAGGLKPILRNQYTPAAVVSVDGMPLGGTLTPDIRRIDATGAHIARGLCFLEYGRVVESRQVWVRSHPKQASNEFLVQEFDPIYTRCSERRYGKAGSGFRYKTRAIEGVSIWLIVQYDYLAWFCVVREPTL